MRKRPLISVVIPSYNSADYIEETLHSLSIQTSKDFEVIIIDDQSEDKTIQVANTACERFGIEGIITVRPDHIAKGVSNCRNLGIQKAAGTWISFLDSDDLFLPGKIAGTIALIEQYGETCFAFHHAARQFEDGTNVTLSIPERKSDNEPKDITGDLVIKNTITTSAVTIKKSLIDEIGGFDSTLHGVEDYMLWLRVSKRTQWYYSSDLWTDYRVRASSLMGGREMSYYVTQNKNLLDAVKQTNEFNEYNIAAVERYFFDDVMNYYSIVALNGRGWGDFLRGLKALSSIGKTKLAIALFNKHFKFFILKKLQSLKDKSTGKKILSV